MFKRCQAYLDFFKSNQRIKGAGFVKWILNDCVATVIIQVNNAPVFGRLDLPVYILGTKFSLGDIRIDCGKGCFEKEVSLAHLEKNGIHPEEIAGVYIILSADSELRAQWNENKLAVQEPKTVAVIRVAQKPPHVGRIKNETNDEVREEEQDHKAVAKQQPYAVNDATAEGQPYEANLAKEIPYAVNHAVEQIQPYEADAADAQEPIPLKGEKWAAIIAILPREDRYCVSGQKEVVSLTPKDLSLINHKYLNLTQNSFLLHGFYNYKKLLLARHAADGFDKYYLGVPGNYYDRENKLANMFGFDIFEDEASILNPSNKNTQKPGEFGYYWKEVEI